MSGAAGEFVAFSPPGGTPRLYGRQDARRYVAGASRSADGGKFDFTNATIKPLIQLAGNELAKL